MQQQQTQQGKTKPAYTRVLIQMPEHLLESVDARATEEMMSRTGLVRIAIKQFLERAEKTPLSA